MSAHLTPAMPTTSSTPDRPVPAATPLSTILLPLKIDAFVLNPSVATASTPTSSKIAPISQPNYTFLRLDNNVIQNDVLQHVDLHHTSPASFNSRITDLGKRDDGQIGELRANRIGVYLHWIMPRSYRSGTAATPGAKEKQREVRHKRGLGSDGDSIDHSAPEFVNVPPRWLVVRRINDMDAITPHGADIPEVQAWVVESDRRRGVDDLGPEVDLQVDVSPFVHATPGKEVDIEQQAEVFIGYKKAADEWEEDPSPLVGRVSLSLLSSSNQLFADYQPHNSNVFSIVDTFEYIDSNDGTTNHLETANASYYVIGWHNKREEDLFYMVDDTVSRAARMASTGMGMKDPTGAGVKTWEDSHESARLLCHGAMYGVEWDVNSKPAHVPADIYSEKLNKDMPVAVGATPLDSLMAYVSAHGETSKGEIHDLEEDLLQIQALLQAQDDGVDAVREAKDMLYNINYDLIAGGVHYYLSGSDSKGKPTTPDQQQIDHLAELNRVQYALDLTQRTIKRLRWEMFSLWWKFASDMTSGDPGEPERYKLEVTNLTDRINALSLKVQDFSGQVEAHMGEVPTAKPGVLGGFGQARDPTLVVAGIESGWAYDYLKILNVRLNSQVIAADTDIPDSWKPYISDVLGRLPEELIFAATGLLGEFVTLSPERNPETPKKGHVFPQFHDQGANPDKNANAPWRDRWENTQPWFPLFLEWEAEYTHIPFDHWDIEELTSRESTDPKIRYVIKEQFDLAKENIKDRRTISGRVLILPQPSFSLQAKIDQLLSDTPQDILDQYLTKKQREELQSQLYKLAFLSSPLSGLTDHLVTMVQGSHIKPNQRAPGEAPQPMKAALKPAAGFERTQLEQIGIESDLTPYGSLVQFLDQAFCAFKPVTHGQFCFTKVNIIDKFGQAIHAIDPTPSRNGPPALYPCISEFYEPQLLAGTPNTANTVLPPKEAGFSEFIQLPPSINQPSRLNASFVKHDPGLSDSYWRSVTEWESPIWGWIVINYADSGIQIFLADGTFYREVRVGGPKGASSSPTWLPLAPPEKQPQQDAQQLDLLLDELQDKTYLRAFIDMINESLASAPAAPNAYGQFLNSVVGMPLALVNMGWSLELATDAYVNQSSLNGEHSDPEKWLLPNTEPEPHPRDTYRFCVKLGDKQRTYDGLVGYFNAREVPKPGDELDLSTLYTYFPSPTVSANESTPSGTNPLRTIDKSNYPLFSPFWIKPDYLVPAQITTARNQHLSVYGAIVNPFVPIHGFSSFLPVGTLTLPSWTWQAAMNKMTAFFHLGPLVVTQDVPVYDRDYRLTANYNLADEPVVPKSAVGIPAMAAADWNWLQPYVDGTGRREQTGGRETASAAGDTTAFMALGMGAIDNRPRFEKAPYNAIEGYLQLKAPIVRT